MTDAGAPRPIAGLHLRYLLTLHLADCGKSSIAGLVAAVEQAGFALTGRPSKAVSDALRWEVRRGRVVRLARGRYGPGTMPRQTRNWMRRRMRSVQEVAERPLSSL